MKLLKLPLLLICFLLALKTQQKQKTYADLFTCQKDLLDSSKNCSKNCQKSVEKCLKHQGSENEEINELDSCKNYFQYMNNDEKFTLNNQEPVSYQDGADFHGCVYWCIKEYVEDREAEMFLLKYRECAAGRNAFFAGVLVILFLGLLMG